MNAQTLNWIDWILYSILVVKRKDGFRPRFELKLPKFYFEKEQPQSTTQ